MLPACPSVRPRFKVYGSARSPDGFSQQLCGCHCYLATLAQLFCFQRLRTRIREQNCTAPLIKRQISLYINLHQIGQPVHVVTLYVHAMQYNSPKPLLLPLNPDVRPLRRRQNLLSQPFFILQFPRLEQVSPSLRLHLYSSLLVLPCSLIDGALL